MIQRIDTLRVQNSTNLQESDIGKYYFMINGSMVGFCDSYEEAETLLGYTFN